MQSSSKPSTSISEASKAVQPTQPAQVKATSPELQAKDVAASGDSQGTSLLSQLSARWAALSGDRLLVAGLIGILVLTMFLFANKGSNNCILSFSSCNPIAPVATVPVILALGASAATVLVLTTAFGTSVMVAVGAGFVVGWIVSQFMH
ncbi:hypothetical protein APA_4730 [Pseudanabaena sp. lw0831]|uniref:hypothetical protein n=1 Tax=Pseudanabaena sp. lw0831 TaxID=1357935 RepID=UPI0019155711|nr:hypothetical protein [Pseudanabaena sp. lw0831]GBO56394.1 hypothetical protein APA_4730 [Pseudanabaena sp. lw0831]